MNKNDPYETAMFARKAENKIRRIACRRFGIEFWDDPVTPTDKVAFALVLRDVAVEFYGVEVVDGVPELLTLYPAAPAAYVLKD